MKKQVCAGISKQFFFNVFNIPNIYFITDIISWKTTRIYEIIPGALQEVINYVLCIEL